MANKSKKSSSKWEIKGLAAVGPDPSLKERILYLRLSFPKK